jgi:hypothetical protein
VFLDLASLGPRIARARQRSKDASFVSSSILRFFDVNRRYVQLDSE